MECHIITLKVHCKCFRAIFRRPSQLRWGASNSLIIQGEEGGEEGEISFLSIVSDLKAQEYIENQYDTQAMLGGSSGDARAILRRCSGDAQAILE